VQFGVLLSQTVHDRCCLFAIRAARQDHYCQCCSARDIFWKHFGSIRCIENIRLIDRVKEKIHAKGHTAYEREYNELEPQSQLDFHPNFEQKETEYQTNDKREILGKRPAHADIE
jgi:hypothetical protein